MAFMIAIMMIEKVRIVVCKILVILIAWGISNLVVHDANVVNFVV